jgi:hypothetical protein
LSNPKIPKSLKRWQKQRRIIMAAIAAAKLLPGAQFRFFWSSRKTSLE